MTAVAVSLTGAFSTSAKWDSINWKNTEAEVHRLQMHLIKCKKVIQTHFYIAKFFTDSFLIRKYF